MDIIYASKALGTENNIFGKNTCVSLGNFDGVHIGHRKLAEASVEYAAQNGLVPVVYTFENHPSSLLGNTKELLCTNEEKCSLLESTGCHGIYFDDFGAVKDESPEDFCREVLVKKLSAAAVFCGENFRFGKDAAGTPDTLGKELAKLGVSVFVIPYVSIGDSIVSSTMIRRLVSEGKAEEARAALGCGYMLTGKVVHGKHLATVLGFPTANFYIADGKVVPKNGVYCSCAEIEGKLYPAVSNIGVRPTTDKAGSRVNCETFIIGFSGDAYGKILTVCLYSRIRDERKFDSLDSLADQIRLDVSYTEHYFTENTLKGIGNC